MNLVAVVLVVVAIGAAVHVGTTAVVRWADDRSVGTAWPPRCVTDQHDLSPGDVVPVWSWLVRRGRCRTCHASIPVTVPIVEVVLLVVMGAVALRHPGPQLAVLLPVAWSAVVATPVDLARHIIPNRLTYPLAAWSIVAVTGVAAIGGDWSDWRRALLVGAALPVGMEVFALAFFLLRGVRGMGLGDVKWAVSLGIATGWLGSGAVVVLLAGTIVSSGVVAAVLLAMGRAGSARIAYGPFLAIGTVLALLAPAGMIVDVVT